MNQKKQKNTLLIVVSVVCIILIAVTAIKDSFLSPLRAAVGYVLMPVQSGVNTVGRALYNSVENNRKLHSALDENAELNKKMEEILRENTLLEENEAELLRLRKLYKLSENYGQYNMVGARIIAKDSGGWFQIFRIDKGSSDGIKVDMNVMAGDGLVGIVTDVGANYATVRSIIDDVSRVSAMTLTTGDTCIISGDLKQYEQGRLLLSDAMESAQINNGDKIVTSNISSKYLPGILIGYASDIETDINRLTKSGYLIPAADFSKLQEVLVITDLKADYSGEE